MLRRESEAVEGIEAEIVMRQEAPESLMRNMMRGI